MKIPRLPPFGRRAFLGGTASALAFLPWTRASAQDAQASRPVQNRDERMSFLANDRVRLGIDLAKGGAITHLADLARGPENIINSHDLGRQIQMSYYAGPIPYRVPGHAGPRPVWEAIGWNPIQVGDDYGNASRIVDQRNDGHELYVKCVPMQWPLDDVPGECTFESWLRLEGNVVHSRCRLVMARTDRTQWPAREQEVPAVYTNGPWHDLVTYRGDRPFTGDALTHIDHPFDIGAPCAEWTATENWAALLDDSGHGLGVWSPATAHFTGGFYGKKGAGGPRDAPTGYIGPSRVEIIDHDIVHEYRYALVCGDVEAIRSWVYAQPRATGAPSWSFAHDRQGWSYVDAGDTGWPIRGALNIRPHAGKTSPQIIGPAAAWQAHGARRVTVRGRFTDVSDLRLLWKPLDAADFVSDPAALVQVGAGMDEIVFDLSRCAGYRDLVTQLRLDPKVVSDSARIVLHSVSLS